MPFDLCSKFSSFSFGETLRRVSAVSATSTNLAPNNFRFRNRRAAFAAVHFKKEKIVKQLETAIGNSDVTMIDEVVAMVNIAELEEDDLSFVKTSCEHGNLDVAAALLRHGANVDSLGDGNYGPLHIAVKTEHLPMSAILMSNGADVNLPSKYELKTPLQLAVKTGSIDMVKLLLTNNAEVNKPDLYGGQALHVACRTGNVDMVTVLLNHGAEIDRYDNEGWTGIHFASVAGHKHVVKYLASRHANLDCQSKYGRTSLHWACGAAQLGAVNELLSSNANANIRDSHGKLALDYATDETVRTLVKIYTDKPDLNKKFVSTIGLHIHIDPRQKRYSDKTTYSHANGEDTEFHNSKEAKQKRWKSADALPDRSSTINTLPEEEMAVIAKRTRERESLGTVSKVSVDVHSSYSMLPSPLSSETLSSIESDNVFASFSDLYTETTAHIDDLSESFKDFYGVMAMASDSDAQLSNDNYRNAVLRLASVQDSLVNFRTVFRSHSEEFLHIVNSEKKKNFSKTGGSPAYIALVALFTDAIQSIFSTHPDENIWESFLAAFDLDEEIQAVLKIRLKLDSSMKLEDRIRHCIRFWARACAVGSEGEGRHFMKTVLQCARACDNHDETDKELVSEILKTFVANDFDFRTGSRYDQSLHISQLVESLHENEARILLRSLNEATANANIFPSLELLERDEGSYSRSQLEISRESETLYHKLKAVLEEEDTHKLVMAVRFLILCGREDLLTLLL